MSREVAEADRSLVMALSQAYLEWEQETERRGIQQERRAAIESLLKVRFGSLDEQLSTIVPALLEMTAEEYTPLLLQLSREELIARFQDATATE